MQPSCYLSDLRRFAVDTRMKGVLPGREEGTDGRAGPVVLS